MRGLFYILSLLIATNFVFGQIVIPDDNFLAHLKAFHPQVIAGENTINADSAALVPMLNLQNSGISDLEGLQYFTDLLILQIGNNPIKHLPDISGLELLESLDMSYLSISSAEFPDFSNFLNLRRLILSGNDLENVEGLVDLLLMTELRLDNNRIQELPDLDHLLNLYLIDLSDNRLVSLPAFPRYRSLYHIYASDNNLKSVPLNYFVGEPFDSVRLDNNYLSYEYLSVLKSDAHEFDEVFTYNPQKNIKVFEDNYAYREGNELNVSTDLDEEVPGVKYQWYHNNQVLDGQTDRFLFLDMLTKEHEGTYFVELSHDSFSKDFVIRSNSFMLEVKPCLVLDELVVTVNGSSCMQNGVVVVEAESWPEEDVIFELIELEPNADNEVLVSPHGQFSGLMGNSYQMAVITADMRCRANYDQTINLPNEGCAEAILTPDGDGINDEYYFEGSGEVTIYDKEGNFVNSILLPAVWDGRSQGGQLMPPGYYVTKRSDSEEIIRISLFY